MVTVNMAIRAFLSILSLGDWFCRLIISCKSIGVNVYKVLKLWKV